MKNKNLFKQAVSMAMICVFALGLSTLDTSATTMTQNFDGLVRANDVTLDGWSKQDNTVKYNIISDDSNVQGSSNALQIINNSSKDAWRKARYDFIQPSDTFEVAFRTKIMDLDQLKVISFVKANSFANSDEPFRVSYQNTTKKFVLGSGSTNFIIPKDGAVNYTIESGDWVNIKVLIDTKSGKAGAWIGNRPQELKFLEYSKDAVKPTIKSIAFNFNKADASGIIIDDLIISEVKGIDTGSIGTTNVSETTVKPDTIKPDTIKPDTIQKRVVIVDELDMKPSRPPEYLFKGGKVSYSDIWRNFSDKYAEDSSRWGRSITSETTRQQYLVYDLNGLNITDFHIVFYINTIASDNSEKRIYSSLDGKSFSEITQLNINEIHNKEYPYKKIEVTPLEGKVPQGTKFIKIVLDKGEKMNLLQIGKVVIANDKLKPDDLVFKVDYNQEEEEIPSNGILDIKGHWSEKNIDYLVYKKVIAGYPDNTFKPEENLQVDEFIKMAVSARGVTLPNGDSYWASTYIDKAKEMEIIFEGEFDDYQRLITRNEIARIIIRASIDGYPANVDEYKKYIKDYELISGGFKPYIVKAISKGIITGYSDGEFKGNNQATRAEAATMVTRMLNAKNRVNVEKIPVAFREYPADKSNYPKFSWDNVPLYGFFQNKKGFSDETIKLIADNFDIMVLEKSHGVDTFGSTEKGIINDTKKIKALNPNIKTIEYFNLSRTFQTYEANRLSVNNRPDFIIRDKYGKKYGMNTAGGDFYYDISNPEVRDYWTDVAAGMVNDPNIDGVFVDHVSGTIGDMREKINLYGEQKAYALLEGVGEHFKELREKLGNNEIILYNGVKRFNASLDSESWNKHRGLGYLNYSDGLLNEDWIPAYIPAEQAVIMIEDMQKASKQGKITFFQGWTPVIWNNPQYKTMSLESIKKIAKENLTYPLAIYLVSAGEYSYFAYAWGWDEEHGRTEIYDEFKKPLGKPLSDAVRNGNIFTREFEHASVWLDVENKTAKIDWR